MFSQALADGRLRPDSSLVIEQPVDVETLPTEETAVVDSTDTTETPDAAATAGTTTYSVQYETPDVASVSSTEAAVRGISGVRFASTGSLALGGVSVMRVTFAGDLGALKAALSARGFKVQEGGGALRISR